MALACRPLVPAFGAEVSSHSPAEAADLVRRAEAGDVEGRIFVAQLGDALKASGMVVFRGTDGRTLGPPDLRALYASAHAAIGVQCTPPGPGTNRVGKGTQRSRLPGWPETQVLGHNYALEDFYGLSGYLKGDPDVWWHAGEDGHGPNWREYANGAPGLSQRCLTQIDRC